METMWQRVTALGLTPLRTQTISQVTLTMAGTTATQPGAYVQVSPAQVTVTSDAFDTPAQVVAQLASVLASLEAPQLAAPTVTVALQLPETLFARLYETAEFGQARPAYVTFRNTLYKQVAGALAQRLPALAQAWGADPSQLTLALKQVPGPAPRAITAVQLGGWPALAGPVGITASALGWLRDALWAAMTGEAGALKPVMAGIGAAWPTFDRATEAPGVLGTDWLHQPLPGATALSRDTQLMLVAAYQRGLRVTVLDAAAELVQLTAGTHREWLQHGTLTRLDSAITQGLTASKQAQKHLLAAAGLPVARVQVYRDLASAQADWTQSFRAKSLVVKPNGGHGGQGVSVFPVPTSAAAFATAYQEAAAFGQVMVELFAPGTVTRCVVVAGQVVAALECEPLSVVGDGRLSVTALAQRRGLTIDAKAERVLARQGLTPDAVPLRGHEARLRMHATVTQGVTVDVTDELDASYAALALAAANAIGAQVAAVDLLLVNRYQPLDAEHPELAKVLSVSLAPKLTPHAAPTLGQPRALAPAILAALVPSD